MCSKTRGLRMLRGDRKAINPAVERREASISRKRCKAPRKRLRAYVTGPRNGCRCTRAPVGAPLPLFEGEASKPRRTNASREG
jgi:hypothetical protein